jgi:hypothetical protein
MAAEALKEMEIPAGGIADYILTDEELKALDEADAEEFFGRQGIATFKPIAERMASYGRWGDDHVAHVETGELVVPKRLIDQSPELKESVFKHLRELGVENPEQYVVGSGKNSINPNTGIPEFGLGSFFKAITKPFKSVARAVKKVVKKVVKVVKKVAPIVLPVVLGMTGLGPIYGAALGSGIGTLVQGGSLKDAFKSALVSGATGALFAGGQSMWNGGSFMEGVSSAAADPLGRLSQTVTNVGDAFSAGSVSDAFSTAFKDYVPAAPTPVPANTAVTPQQAVQQAQSLTPSTATIADQGYTGAEFDAMMSDYATVNPESVGVSMSASPSTATIANQGYTGAEYDAMMADYPQSLTTPAGTPVAQTNVTPQTPQTPATSTGLTYNSATGQITPATEPSFFGNLSEGNIGEAFSPTTYTAEDVLVTAGIKPLEASAQQLKAAANIASNINPTFMQSWGPTIGATALAGGAALSASGAFDIPEQTPPEGMEYFDQTGFDVYAANPDQYYIGGTSGTGGYTTDSSGALVYDPQAPGALDPRLAANREFEVASTRYNPFTDPNFIAANQEDFNILFGDNPAMFSSTGTQMYAADGGEVYPRRTGGIMPNEGVPNKDSVRAALMPGEFVMTKNAVRGLGNGSLKRGIKNMYSVMRDLETKGRRYA